MSLSLPDFDRSDFRNKSNKILTKGLFYELSYYSPENCIFTLKDQDYIRDGKTYFSLKRLYLAIVPQDPTEYIFAQTIFKSWEVWDVIRSAPQLKDYVKAWRDEVAVRIKSEAIQAIANEMHSNGRNGFQAAKLLLDRGWIEKEDLPKRAKERKAEEERLDKEALRLLSEDAGRLGIKLN